jgi:parallel beta-helix repeat protein
MKIFLLGAMAAVVVVAAGSALAASSATRFVSTSGTDAGDCTSAPCRTIGYAVGQANSGDTVSIAAGTYSESVAVTKRLALVGHHATIDAAGKSTMLNGSPYYNGIVVLGPGAAGTSIRGLTIQNAGLEGIFADMSSDLTIADNTLEHNDAFGPFHPLCAAQPDDCGEALHLQSVTGSTVSGNLVQDNVGGILLTDEEGPTAKNTIAGNTVLDNELDCGITLASHWFQFGSAVAPDVSGVYQNKVFGNASNGNGAAGIGIFAGPPGAAAWGNIVEGNTAMDNGLPGVAIHSHTAFQNANDNVVINNRLSGNGPDDDNPAADEPTGISVFADVETIAPPVLPAAPITRVVVSANRISDEHFGIVLFGATASGLPSNKYGSVDVPVLIH